MSTVSAIEYTRDTLGYVQGNWVIKQQAFDLTDIGGRESTGWEQMENDVGVDVIGGGVLLLRGGMGCFSFPFINSCYH